MIQVRSPATGRLCNPENRGANLISLVQSGVTYRVVQGHACRYFTWSPSLTVPQRHSLQSQLPVSNASLVPPLTVSTEGSAHL